MGLSKILLFTNPSWCQPCKSLDTVIENVTFDVPLVKMTTGASATEDTKKGIAKYQVKSIPTLVFVDENDNQIDRMSGYSTGIVNTIKSKIKALK